MTSLLGYGVPSPMSMLIILVIMLLLFGNRLPSVMRSLGQSAHEFKKGMEQADSPESDAKKDVKDEKKA